MEKSERADGGQTVRIGLNGFGRIGRNVLRASLSHPSVEIVGINDIMDPEDMRYLLAYDSVSGRVEDVSLTNGALSVGETTIPIHNEKDPADLPWDESDVDVAFECTGLFRTYDDASRHLDAGAEKTLISAPPKGEKAVKTLVYGVNHEEYDGEDVVSNASCTTNSVAPAAKVLNERFGIRSGLLTTVHAYTSTQQLLDGPSEKRRRGRAAAENIIPTSTGAAIATTEVLPELEGKLDGMAMRVPVPNGSITDFVVDLEADVGTDEVNDAFRDAAANDLAGILGYTDDELVSRDILGMAYSSIIDCGSTIALDGGLVKVLCWYDNEYGFASRMLDVAQYVANGEVVPTAGPVEA